MECLGYLAPRWNLKALFGCQRPSSPPVCHIWWKLTDTAKTFFWCSCGGWTEAVETYTPSCRHGWWRCGIDDSDAPNYLPSAMRLCSRRPTAEQNGSVEDEAEVVRSMKNSRYLSFIPTDINTHARMQIRIFSLWFYCFNFKCSFSFGNSFFTFQLCIKPPRQRHTRAHRCRQCFSRRLFLQFCTQILNKYFWNCVYIWALQTGDLDAGKAIHSNDIMRHLENNKEKSKFHQAWAVYQPNNFHSCSSFCF